jgi:3-isopropylmalate/(R)-2-methylmalate dehydratase large subunit
MSKTLFDKVWDAHVVRKIEDGPDVFYWPSFHTWGYKSSSILGLKSRNIPVLYPERTFATADHNTLQ